MAESFKLHGSSYEEFVKILKAYGTGKIGNPMTLTAVAQTAGMDKTIVSRNNGFLVQLSLISEGSKKSPTQEGLDLGRAYSLKMDEQIVKIWRTIIENDEFLSRMLSAVRIRNGMEKTSFVNHILYSSGSSNTNSTRAGANTIIEIYKVAKLVDEQDGQIVACEVIDTDSSEGDSNSYDSIITSKEPNSNISSSVIQSETAGKKIVININIDARVDELDELADKIKNLMDSLNG